MSAFSCAQTLKMSIDNHLECYIMTRAEILTHIPNKHSILICDNYTGRPENADPI